MDHMDHFDSQPQSDFDKYISIKFQLFRTKSIFISSGVLIYWRRLRQSPPPPHLPCNPSLHTQPEKEKEKEKQKEKEKEKEQENEMEKEKEKEKEKENSEEARISRNQCVQTFVWKLNSLKCSFLMFEISVENRFESREKYQKYDPKVTKMGVWGGSGTEWGPESFQDAKSQNYSPPFWGHFGVSLVSKIW